MNANTPIVISCCSCKGGAGRSTAAANIACALMLEGKQVLLLDMDFGAPGLHEILRVAGLDIYSRPSDRTDDRSIMGLQHLFNEYSEGQGFVSGRAKWFLENQVFCLRNRLAGAATSTEHKLSIENSTGEVVYVPSSPRPPDMSWLASKDEGSKKYIRRLQDLIPMVANRIAGNKINFDFIILDSASGISAEARPTHEVSHILLIFYRESLQHSAGTAAMVSTFLYRRKIAARWRGKRIVTIPSCTESRHDLNLDRRIEVKINEQHQSIKELFAEFPDDVNGGLNGLSIRDDRSMHFFERVVINEEGTPVLEDYTNIARYLTQEATAMTQGNEE